MELDQIKHKFVSSGGLKLHKAEIGEGPNVVVFLHGFSEIWYTWRHQMIALANAGFRAIAPDYRGYGLSDPPPEPEKASLSDLLNDLLGILDALSLTKVLNSSIFLWMRKFSKIVTERVLGVVTLGAPYVPPGPSVYEKYLPEGFYILRWREPGRAEADFGCLDAKTVVRNIYILFSRSEIPVAQENQEIMDLVEPSAPLPPWITEEALKTYGGLYEKSGFQTALQVPYRSSGGELNLADSGVKELVKSEKAKKLAPNLEITFIPEGTHFVHEQLPKQVNQLILTFLGKHI